MCIEIPSWLTFEFLHLLVGLYSDLGVPYSKRISEYAWLVVQLFLKLTANERRGKGALDNGPDSTAPCYGYCRALEEHCAGQLVESGEVRCEAQVAK